MKKTPLFTPVCAALSIFCAGFFAAPEAAAVAAEISVRPLPPLVVAGTNPPQGVAGAFASVAENGEWLIVAGGCNFPDKGPADGGKKVFYKTVFRLNLKNPESGWEILPGELARPAAYGMSVGDLWLGGENAETKMDTTRLAPFFAPTTTLFPLPAKMDNAAADTLADETGAPVALIVAGGNTNGAPTNRAWILEKPATDIDTVGWRALPNFPGSPRVQPVGGTVKTPRGDAFALVGGFFFDKEKNLATLDRAGVIFFPKENRWEKIPPLPSEISEAGLAGASAVEDGRGGLLIFGGVNAKIFKDALENPPPDYLRRDPAWYKFNADVLRLSFDADGNAVWEKLATIPATARAGASVVSAGDDTVALICGELKPGVRATDCVLLKIRFDDAPAR